MIRSKPDRERVWLNAMNHAIGGLASIDAKHEAPVNWTTINRELARDAAQLADGVLEEWLSRFPEGTEEPAL